jgi:hypothetical protein
MKIFFVILHHCTFEMRKGVKASKNKQKANKKQSQKSKTQKYKKI